MASTSVSELAVATMAALTRPAQPDTEDIDQSHDRIASTMAAPFQKESLVEHYESVASDHMVEYVVLFRFVSFPFLSFRFSNCSFSL